MKVGGYGNLYPGKYFQRMEQQRGLQGINRERMQLHVSQMQTLGSQIFTNTAAAAEQLSILSLQQLQSRLTEEAARSSDGLQQKVLDLSV